MSLNFRLDQIADWENVTQITAVEDHPTTGVTAGDRIQNPVTTSLIWSTMAVGLGEISEENAEKYFGRLRLYETLFGAFMYRGTDHEGPAEITPEEVVAHIGLTTNVSDESDTKWRKRMLDHYAADTSKTFKRTARLSAEQIVA